MKKVLFAVAIVSTAFVACNSSETKEEKKDTVVAPVETPKMDTPVVKIDSPAVVAPKVDSPATKK